MNGLTDYQNRQMEKMLKFLRGIDLSQEEIQTLIWLAGWEESTIDTFLSIMDKVVMVVNIVDLKIKVIAEDVVLREVMRRAGILLD